MFEKILILIIIVIASSCGSERNYFEHGKFKLYVEEEEPMIVERNSKYQIEYSLDGGVPELFIIQWQGDSLYQLKTVNKKDTIDFNDLFVKIDSTNNDTLYLTSYMEGIDFKVSSKMIKIDDKFSDKFKETLKNISSTSH
jgi:hypothetical protein